MFHLTTPLEIPSTFQRQMNAERRGYWETKQQLIMAIEPWTLKEGKLGKWLGSRKWRHFPGFLRSLFSGMFCKCTILQRIAGKSTMKTITGTWGRPKVQIDYRYQISSLNAPFQHLPTTYQHTFLSNPLWIWRVPTVNLFSRDRIGL